MDRQQFQQLIGEIITSSEFQKLAFIGGHKKYHLEGNALKHSYMVFSEAQKMFPEDYTMQPTALLHDVGKIYSSIQNGEDDWVYPNHAAIGAAKLHCFIPKDLPEFEQIQWYIANHIKPLFWKEDKQDYSPLVEGCSIRNLVKLVICDLQGSISAEPQTALLKYLMKQIRD